MHDGISKWGLFLLLLFAASTHAQTAADYRRMEREAVKMLQAARSPDESAIWRNKAEFYRDRAVEAERRSAKPIAAPLAVGNAGAPKSPVPTVAAPLPAGGNAGTVKTLAPSTTTTKTQDVVRVQTLLPGGDSCSEARTSDEYNRCKGSSASSQGSGR